MSIKYSKNEVKVKVGEREYSTFKWSVITTLSQGKKLAGAVAPSISTMADMWMANKKDEGSLEEIIEGTDIEFLLTGAITQLSNNFTDEHFEELCNSLLSNYKYRERQEDGEMGQFIDIEDWSEHFDEYQEDFEAVLIHSAKVNLYDFFMKQPTVRSSIEKVLTVVNPLLENLKNDSNEDTNSK